MSELSPSERVLRSSLKANEAFRAALKEALEELRISVKELSKASGIPESTLYKLILGKRSNPRLSTYRIIINTLRKLEGREEKGAFIAVIAARPTLDAIKTKYIEVRGRRILLKEYAATTIEEVIIAAVKAERDGAKAIVCAPIVSTSVEKIVEVPVSACPVLFCRQPILKAAELAALKMVE